MSSMVDDPFKLTPEQAREIKEYYEKNPPFSGMIPAKYFQKKQKKWWQFWK